MSNEIKITLEFIAMVRTIASHAADRNGHVEITPSSVHAMLDWIEAAQKLMATIHSTEIVYSDDWEALDALLNGEIPK
jgi:protein involved in ribonucleotide reduction